MNLPAGVVADTYTNEFAAGTPAGSTWVGATIERDRRRGDPRAGRDGLVRVRRLRPARRLVGQAVVHRRLHHRVRRHAARRQLRRDDEHAVRLGPLARVQRDLPARQRPGRGLLQRLRRLPVRRLQHGQQRQRDQAIRAAPVPTRPRRGTRSSRSTASTCRVPHRFRIEWNTASVEYYVDGQHKRTAPIADRRADAPDGVRLPALRCRRPGPLDASGQLSDGGQLHLARARRRPGRQRLAEPDGHHRPAVQHRRRPSRPGRARRRRRTRAGRRGRTSAPTAPSTSPGRPLHPVHRALDACDADEHADAQARADHACGRHGSRADAGDGQHLARRAAHEPGRDGDAGRLQRPGRRPDHLPLPVAEERHADRRRDDQHAQPRTGRQR